MARLTELLEGIAGITMSQGTVANMLDRSVRLLDPLYSGIRDAVAASGVVGGDETGLRVNGRKRRRDGNQHSTPGTGRGGTL